jgi:hypothetical protein
MRFSIVLAIIFVAVFAVLYIQATFGEHAPVVFGILGFSGVYLFFKHFVNA